MLSKGFFDMTDVYTNWIHGWKKKWSLQIRVGGGEVCVGVGGGMGAGWG